MGNKKVMFGWYDNVQRNITKNIKYRIAEELSSGNNFGQIVNDRSLLNEDKLGWWIAKDEQ